MSDSHVAVDNIIMQLCATKFIDATLESYCQQTLVVNINWF